MLVLAALADRTRLALVRRLARKSATATQMASGSDISRQAIHKHLAVLARARLVTRHKVGREVRYSLDRRPLDRAIDTLRRI